MDFNDLRTDATLEVEGKEIVLKTDAKGKTTQSITIARHNNKKFTEFLAQKLKPYEFALAQGAMDSGLMEKITLEGMAHHIVKGWTGFTDDGAEVKYTPKAAEKYLNEVPRFREMVSQLCQREENYRLVAKDAALKNSQPASAGN